MIGFLLALLLWMLGHGPTPTPHEVRASPAAPAPASVVVRGDEPRTPGRHPGAVTPAAPATSSTVAEPAPRTYFPQTWTPVLTPPPAPELPPVATGPELDTGPMCHDPIDCPPGQ